MAYDYDGASAGGITKLGKLEKTRQNICDDPATDMRTRVPLMLATYDQSTDGMWLAALTAAAAQFDQQGNAGVAEGLRQTFITSFIEQLYRDAPGLPAKTPLAAARRLREIMVADSKTFNRTAVTVSAAAVTGTGTGTAIIGIEEPYNGRTWQNVYSETLTARCIEDGQANPNLVGKERWQVTSDKAFIANRMHLDWPGGNGINLFISTTDPTVDGLVDTPVGQQLLSNGDFGDFSVTNTPDRWEITAGTAGGTIQKSTTAIRNSSALKFVGNGSENTAIRQLLGDDTPTAYGTLGRLKPFRAYALSFRIRHDGSAPAAGVLTVNVVDGSNNVITTNATVSVTLSGISASFVQYQLKFVAPASIPDATYVRIRLSTALTNAEEIHMGDFCLHEQHSCGQTDGLVIVGPHLSIPRGATDSVRNDTIVFTITNDYAGLLIKMLYRYLGDIPMNWPDSGTPNIADALIA